MKKNLPKYIHFSILFNFKLSSYFSFILNYDTMQWKSWIKAAEHIYLLHYYMCGLLSHLNEVNLENWYLLQNHCNSSKGGVRGIIYNDVSSYTWF